MTKNWQGRNTLSAKMVDSHRGQIKEKLPLKDASSLIHHAAPPLRHVVGRILNEAGTSVPITPPVGRVILASMQAQGIMDEPNLDPDSMDTKSALRVVIAYNDLASGKRAMRVMTDLGKGLGDEMEFQPLPWSFHLLADMDWRELAAHDAVNADILIIATSSASPLPPAVWRWAEAAISRKRGTAAAVVALFGTEENPDAAGSPRMEAIQAAAQRAGLDFFAPAPRHELDEAIARIHLRAEMVTPVLEKILDHDHSYLHGGINE